MNKKSPTGCRADQLFGLWFLAPETLDAYREQATAMDLDAMAKANAEAEAAELRVPIKPEDPPKEPAKPYQISNGVAVIEISGPTTKYPTSFSRVMGGTSTLMVEKALMQASADPEVNSIMLHFDSAPGGTVAGAYELVDRIHSVKGKGKPIVAHGSDQMTSAAYLFASACDSITANRNAVIGSIGTRSQLIDTSEKLKKDGIKVIPVAAGKFKSAGMDGTKITPDQVKEFQRQIEAMNDQFIADVVKGRPNLTAEKVRAMEARCFIGAEALGNGLIDGVCSFESVLSALQQNKTSFGISGIPGVVTKPAAPNERKLHMEILTQLRELFGAAEMSEEQALAKVRALKSDAVASSANAVAKQTDIDRLTKENAELLAFKPKAVDLEALKDRADLYADKIDVAVAKQEFTPVMAGKIKSLVLKDGKPNTFWLSRVDSIDARPIDAIVGLFAGEKLGGPATGSQTGTQILDRHVPGGEQTAADLQRAEGAKQAKEYQDAARAARGIA